MRVLEVRAASAVSRVLVGEKLRNLSLYAPRGKSVLITDANVERLYHPQFPDGERIVLGGGEGIKTLRTVEEVYTRLLDLGADRSTFVVAVGGGVVCDIAGFAAATYLRGLSFGFVATTLLAQVDAGVGGKNGVNFQGYKNMIGVFGQPRFVICDLDLLRTLPRREVLSGLAEVVKQAAIGSQTMFSTLEANPEKALALDPEFLETVVYESLLIKAAIVEKDERESGERRKLNFGHTFGHAIESATGKSHGEAVSLGMAIAAEISVRKKLMERGEADRLRLLLRRLQLPIETALPREKILEAIRKDKKRSGDKICFVFLEGIGRPAVMETPLEELEALLHDLR